MKKRSVIGSFWDSRTRAVSPIQIAGLLIAGMILPAFGDPLQDAVESPFPIPNTNAFNFATGTAVPGGGWFPQSITTLNAADAAQSGPIPHDSDSRMWTKDPGIGPGILSFWWKVSSEANNDTLSFNGPLDQSFEISGDVDWQPRMIFLPCFFSHFDSLEWRYQKDGSVISGLDAGWVDQVSVLPLGNLPTLENATDYSGGSVISYDWGNQLDGGSVNGNRAVSGMIPNDACSVMMVDFTAPTPIRVCFDWTVSCHASDKLELWVDNSLFDSISGIFAESKCVELPAGRHCLAFKYDKDGSLAAGDDRGTVDNLIVTQLVPRGDLMNAVDTTGAVYGTSWTSVGSPTHDGVDAACALGVGIGERKNFFTTVSGPGTISAWWKVSTEPAYGALALAVDGKAEAFIGGETDWTPVSVPVGPGTHQLEFIYIRTGTAGGPLGTNRAYVDEFVFTPSPATTGDPNLAQKAALQTKIKKLKKKIRQARKKKNVRKVKALTKKLKRLLRQLRAL